MMLWFRLKKSTMNGSCAQQASDSIPQPTGPFDAARRAISGCHERSLSWRAAMPPPPACAIYHGAMKISGRTAKAASATVTNGPIADADPGFDARDMVRPEARHRAIRVSK